ncbi:SDR family oxidoreductase [Xanthobacter autotrophicus]|uniref:SDR family oxidoreductase n=1 Tax=Xanthobacter autotrophicus TaxID=280 RepID=UPI00372B9BED
MTQSQATNTASRPAGGRLAGQRVVVIGGTRGIGFAAAQAVAAEGGEVVVASRNPGHVARAVAALGPSASGHALDIGDRQAAAAFFAQVGPFDHLVTTAAQVLRKSLLEADLDEARASFEGKFWGQVHAARFGAPLIRPGGSIVLVSGISSRRGLGGMAFPSAINGAIEALSRSLAVSLAPIRVNTVSPGYIDTPGHGGAERSAVLKKVAAAIPAGRPGRPEEVAQAIVYLITNPFSTCTVLDIDGGHLAS